jgi:hypothetical protein
MRRSCVLIRIGLSSPSFSAAMMPIETAARRG